MAINRRSLRTMLQFVVLSVAFVGATDGEAGTAFTTDYLTVSQRETIARKYAVGAVLSHNSVTTTANQCQSASQIGATAFGDDGKLAALQNDLNSLSSDTVNDISGYVTSEGLIGEEIAEGCRWTRFTFDRENPRFGDVSVNPFSDSTEYKINGMNYDLYLGDSVRIPFQLYFGDLDSSESPEDNNQQALQDATQGVAIQFPFAWVYSGRKVGGVCNFLKLDGFCVFGGDVTLRSVRLTEVGSDDMPTETAVFGTSAAIRASFIFPIFESGQVDNPAGQLGIGAGIRYFNHNSDHDNLLFGNLADPDGSSIRFDGSLTVLNIESEFEITNQFKLRLDYFKPLDNEEFLDDVVKFSFVVATGGN